MFNDNIFQIGVDVTFELDKFGKPRIRSTLELVKNIILYVLFTKPGQYPSLPHIGLDIQNMLYTFFDDLDEEDLRDQIIRQCNALGVHFENGVVGIRKVMYRNKPSLMVHIEVPEQDRYLFNDDEEKYLIGITFDELDKMIYNISDGRRTRQ